MGCAQHLRCSIYAFACKWISAKKMCAVFPEIHPINVVVWKILQHETGLNVANGWFPSGEHSHFCAWHLRLCLHTTTHRVSAYPFGSYKMHFHHECIHRHNGSYGTETKTTINKHTRTRTRTHTTVRWQQQLSNWTRITTVVKLNVCEHIHRHMTKIILKNRHHRDGIYVHTQNIFQRSFIVRWKFSAEWASCHTTFAKYQRNFIVFFFVLEKFQRKSFIYDWNCKETHPNGISNANITSQLIISLTYHNNLSIKRIHIIAFKCNQVFCD